MVKLLGLKKVMITQIQNINGQVLLIDNEDNEEPDVLVVQPESIITDAIKEVKEPITKRAEKVLSEERVQESIAHTASAVAMLGMLGAKALVGFGAAATTLIAPAIFAGAAVGAASQGIYNIWTANQQNAEKAKKLEIMATITNIDD